jgi:hypothetical protein
MRQTTYGETHKNNVYSKDIDLFLKKEGKSFKGFINKHVLYNQDNIAIDSPALNYLNLLPENKVNKSLKNMIIKEYYECERIYPYLGDLFLSCLFKASYNKGKRIVRYQKKNQNDILNTIDDKNAKAILDWIFNNTNLGRNINIQTHNSNDIVFEVENNFAFTFKYDYDFYNQMIDKTHSDYFYVIIDGYIESVGEIHHLMYNASQNKIPYVVFCYGMSEEVKHNIMINNRKGITKILPVSLDSNDENTLNILNDIAVLHDGDVITSNMGQTISQEVSKDLKKGNRITFFKDKIFISPVCDNNKILKHRKFLLNRLEDAKSKIDVNIEPVKNRVKNFTSKRLNIYIPKLLKENNKFKRELDYGLRVLKTLNGTIYISKTSFKKSYAIPNSLINVVNVKAKSLQSMLDSIKIVVT